MSLGPLYFLAFVALLCVVAWFFRRPFNAKIQRAAPGKFAELSDGAVHYQWYGNPNGSVLVLVHGLTTPSFVWRDMLPGLVDAGYRVLTFDHFGRGFSARPGRAQTSAFFHTEIDELLEVLGIESPVHFLGYSMGGGIVSSYAAERRDRVQKLILLAPTGFRTEMGGFVHWAAAWPVLGDLAMYLFGGLAIRRGAKASALLESVDSEMIALQCRETRYSGFLRAVLSSVRNVTQLDMSHVHKVLADRDVPVLAIFGELDATVPVAGAMALRTLNRQARVVELPGVGHAMAFTHGDAVIGEVIRFLSEK